MGSGSSSNIKSIHIDQTNKSPEDLSKKKNNVPLSGKETSHSEPHTEDQEQDKDAVIETLTKQLCDSESQRLDLEDQVETLTKELNTLNSQNLQREGEQKPCEETMHAKDQYINKLEKEKKELETEVTKMKQRQRKKQKQFNTQMAEYKQEVNFQIMELKEEIGKLKAENNLLTGNKKGQAGDSAMKFSSEEEAPKLPGGEKMALILELSEQVAEQQDKISRLEHKLNEKDQVITDLRTKLKNNSQYLSVLSKSKEEKDSDDIHFSSNENKHTRHKNSKINNSGTLCSTGNPPQKNDRNPYRNELDGLFTVDEESSENEEENLLKLSSNLSGVKADNRRRMSPDHHEENKDAVYDIRPISESFDDLEANNGRDSGLGSAGKREEKSEKKTDPLKSDKITTDWKDITHSLESGSGLSDSDFEQYGPAQSKVSSAPPKLQNGLGVRQKKKSNSLRRHASSRKEDRPPRPGMAFVNTAGTLHKDDRILNKLSPIISPVEVS